MNERIKEFINRATVVSYDELFNLETSRFDREKFAELIVSDIVGAIRGLQVSAQEDGRLNVAATCGTIAELIEIDYGIEE